MDSKYFLSRDAYAELWRLVTRQAPESKPWRDFWIVWIPGWVLMTLALLALGASPFSLVGVTVLAAGGLVTIAIGATLRQLGVVDDHRHPPAG